MSVRVARRSVYAGAKIGPYSLVEALGLVWRSFAGPSLNNPTDMEFCHREIIINDVNPVLTLGMGGDIMMTFGRKWRIDESLQAFFVPCDVVLLNMEGVITRKPKRGPDQKHDIRIIESLAELSDPNRIWLSLANNHAADFGSEALQQSQVFFQDAGMHCFGMVDSPFVDPHPHFRVVTGTQWSNKATADIAWLDEAPEQLRREDAFNLLFPHWAYETECYPRSCAVQQMHSWLQTFDAVAGHHSHTPQPVTVVTRDNALRQLAAYSLGDLCFGLGYKQWPVLKHFPYGIVIRAEIGRLRDSPKQWAIGRLVWSFTDCEAVPGKTEIVTRLSPQNPYFVETR